MRCKVLGFRVVDGKRKDGSEVHGINLCFTMPQADFIGCTAKIEWIGSQSALYNKLVPINADLVNKIIEVDYVPGYEGRAVLGNIEIVKS